MGHRYSIWLLIFSVMAFQVFVNIDAFSKDIQIDDVPKAIQKIIFREIGDIPIDDIDREKDDGEVYFDVEAEAKGIKIELQIAEDDTTNHMFIQGEGCYRGYFFLRIANPCPRYCPSACWNVGN